MLGFQKLKDFQLKNWKFYKCSVQYLSRFKIFFLFPLLKFNSIIKYVSIFARFFFFWVEKFTNWNIITHSLSLSTSFSHSWRWLLSCSWERIQKNYAMKLKWWLRHTRNVREYFRIKKWDDFVRFFLPNS